MKKLRFKKRILIVTGMLLLLACFINAQSRQAEYLNRGIIRVRDGSTNYVSWRLLGHEPANTGFTLYREGSQIANNITGATFYADNNGSSGSSYTVRAVINGQEQESSGQSLNLTGNYLNVPIQRPGPNHANDASVGDLDGDGEYEIILKWEADNAKDNSQAGVTDNVYLDAYKLNGTRMWRINLGRNIRAGAHYTQFMVYDLDGDGRAEVACKTADGTVDGQGTVIGSSSADYRNGEGYILSGPEYLTVFDGQTGAALSTTNYLPARGNVSSWGDSYGNRVDRFLAAVAYVDGERPSLIMCRGYYTRTVLVAWDFRNGSLQHRWTFDSNNGYSSYAGQGNHNLSVADVDGDGRDEIIFGSMAVDDNGAGLWNSGLGHGDAMHVSDIDPGRPGLEVWGIHENANTGSALLDARTGQIIWSTGAGDVGRGAAADLNGSYVGMECWGGTSSLRSATNQNAGGTPSSANHVIWWDGDLQRELLNGTSVSKYNGGTLLSASGCMAVNGTKSNPTLQVDIFGDWREEVIFAASDSSALRIYTTTTATNSRFYTLMHDPVYRLGIAWQNVAYNQPPHLSYFLGGGMGTAPQPDIYYPGNPQPPITPGPPTDPPTPTTPPTPLPPGTQELQAEDAYFNNGTVESDHAGYTGSGYVNTANEAGAYIEWTVNTSSSGQARAVFTFSNGGGADRPMEVAVNGSVIVSTQSFPANDWTVWETTSVGFHLNSGINTIRLTSLTSDGAANIDKMDLTIEGSTTPDTGDANNDGSVNIIDALMTAQYYVGLNPQGFYTANADVDCNGTINIIDALIIAQYYVGLISSFDC